MTPDVRPTDGDASRPLDYAPSPRPARGAWRAWTLAGLTLLCVVNLATIAVSVVWPRWVLATGAEWEAVAWAIGVYASSWVALAVGLPMASRDGRPAADWAAVVMFCTLVVNSILGCCVGAGLVAR